MTTDKEMLSSLVSNAPKSVQKLIVKKLANLTFLRMIRNLPESSKLKQIQKIEDDKVFINHAINNVETPMAKLALESSLNQLDMDIKVIKGEDV